MARAVGVRILRDMNTTQNTRHTERLNELRKRAAFSRRFIADKSKPLVHRLAEEKALKSWLKSLADLGATE